jgi:ubiquinone/menaquinone biosynthesis C-methylase UbiE
VSNFHRGFEAIDKSTGAISFFEFLDLAAQHPSIIKYRSRMVELCPIADGSLVLDVGCGIGSETTRLANAVGQTGKVTGIDNSEAMIKEAQRRASALTVPVHFELGDAHSLPFKDAPFDLCRAERVLLYLEDPAKAVAEMARVTRSGGHVILFDFDYHSFFIDSDFAEMTRHIEALLAADPRNPLIGRILPHLLRRAGLKVNLIEQTILAPTIPMAQRIYAAALSKGITAGLFTSADVDAWWQEQATMDRDESFYHAHPGYIVAATKP